MNFIDHKKLIEKYFLDKILDDELQLLSRWLKSSNQHITIFVDEISELSCIRDLESQDIIPFTGKTKMEHKELEQVAAGTNSTAPMNKQMPEST